MEKFKYNTIDEAIAAIKAGQMVLVTDDEDRENEGDLIMAAELCTPEAINFMAKEARGLICMPADSEVMDKLQFGAMVTHNTDNHETAFSVSIDHVDTTTGISAYERAYTMKKCAEPGAQPSDFRRPGHVFPLRARKGGVLVRTGHTETTVDLCKLAGLQPVGIGHQPFVGHAVLNHVVCRLADVPQRPHADGRSDQTQCQHRQKQAQQPATQRADGKRAGRGKREGHARVRGDQSLRAEPHYGQRL